MEAWACVVGMLVGSAITILVVSLCSTAYSADSHIEANIEKHWRAKEKEKRNAPVSKEN